MNRSRSAFAAVMTGMGILLVQAQAPAAEEPTLTRPAQATKVDVDPSRMYSTPALAIDPSNPERMVGGFADLRTRRCGIVRSVDGGRTWVKPDAGPGTPSFPFCSQSQGGVIQAPMAFGGGGMLYMGLGGWGEEEAARTGGAVMLARSDDLGDSWETVIARTARGKTGDAAENLRPVQSIAVDPKNGKNDVVYMTFARSRPGLTAPNQAPASPMVAVSRDGGRTFEEPVDLVKDLFAPQAIRDQALAAVTTTTAPQGSTTTTTQPPAAGSKAAQPNQAANFGAAGSRNGMVARTDGKGNAYVIWPTGTANIADAPPSGMALSKSTDGGKTWSTALAIPFSYDNARGGPANAYSQLAVTREGSLHIVYNVNPTPDVANYNEVMHRASYDGGQTWTEPKPIGDAKKDLYAGQYFPNLSVAPNGRIDVAWFDTRDKPGMRATDVYYAYSADDGKTWSKNRRMTDLTIDRRLGVYGSGYDITGQVGIASTNAYAVIGWDDTRNTDEASKTNIVPGAGVQDIYIAAAQFEAIGGGTSSTAKIVLAGVVGLVVVGLVLVLAAVVTKRRTRGVPSPAGESTKVASKVGQR